MALNNQQIIEALETGIEMSRKDVKYLPQMHMTALIKLIQSRSVYKTPEIVRMARDINTSVKQLRKAMVSEAKANIQSCEKALDRLRSSEG